MSSTFTDNIARRIRALRPLIFNRWSAVISVIVAILSNWDWLREKFPADSIINRYEFFPSWEWYHWLITLLILLLATTFEEGYRHSAHRFELAIELKVTSKPPLPPRGRHVAVSIRNQSPKPIEDLWLRIDSYWRNGTKVTVPYLAIIRHDPFIWSSWEDPDRPTKPRGKMDIGSGKQRVVDILECGLEENKAFVTLQTGNTFIGNDAKYVIEAVLEGVYSSGNFEIPISIEVDYVGDKRIDKIDLKLKKPTRVISITKPELTTTLFGP